jgi:hypothetical protein
LCNSFHHSGGVYTLSHLRELLNQVHANQIGS